jgi:autotransporter-associated beta strand protein
MNLFTSRRPTTLFQLKVASVTKLSDTFFIPFFIQAKKRRTLVTRSSIVASLVLFTTLNQVQSAGFVTWNGPSDGDVMQTTFPTVTASNIYILGSGFAHNHGNLSTVFTLDLRSSGTYSTVHSWSQDSADHFLSERTSGGPIAFSSRSVDGIQLTASPLVGNAFHGMHSPVTTFYFNPHIWTASSPGIMTTASNWSTNTVPNATDEVAIISNQPINSGNFTHNGGITLGALVYANTQTRAINGGGATSIHFDVSSGNALVDVAAGAGSLSVNIGVIELQDTTEFRVNNAGGLTIATGMFGSGGVTKTGTGTLTLSGNNSYTGDNTISRGTLSGNTIAHQGQNSDFGQFNFAISNGATLQYTGATASTNRTIALGTGGGTVDVTQQTTSLTVFGQVSGVGSLRKTGAGNLQLEASNTYSGATIIDNGQLRLGANERLPDSTAVTINSNGTLNMFFATETIGSLAGSGNVLNNGNLITGGNNTSTTFSGTITGTGSLTKVGAGTMTLTGNNSYSGGTYINGGTVSGNTIANNGTDSALGRSGFSISNGATLEYTGNATPFAITDRTVELGAGGGKISVTNQPLIIQGVISGAGGLTKTGAGNLTINNPNNSYSGGTTITAGSLSGNTLTNAGLNSNFGTGNFTFANGAELEYYGPAVATDRTINLSNAAGGRIFLAGSLAWNGAISGVGSLTKAGTGTLVLGASNSYGGSTTINQGTLRLAAGERIPNGSAVTVNSAATFDLNGYSETIGSLAGAGNVTLGSGNLTTGGNNGSTTFSGIISGSGGLTKEGTGTMTLTGSNSYAGNTLIANGKTTLANGDDRLPTSTIVLLGHTTSSGKLQLGDATSAQNQKIAGLATSVTGTANAVGGGHATNESRLTVDNTADYTFSGTLGGPGTGENNLGLTKMGTGKLTLTGGNSYSGSTLINGGTLAVNNSSGSATGTGAVTVNSGGTLAGSGRVTGAVAVNNGGTLAPGNSIESIDVGALTFNTGGTFAYEINTDLSLTAAADLVNANGNLGIFAGAILALADLGNTILADGTKFTLISYAGTWNGGIFDGYADDSLVTVGVNRYVLNYNDPTGGQNFGGGDYANNVTLTAAVPEASSFIFGAIVCIALAGVHFGRKLVVRRRSSHKKSTSIGIFTTSTVQAW